jgi:surfactin synthase thioesterase subunit
MAKFVLVHGAWHGPWCWELLARELEGRGHEVAAPDLHMDDPTAELGGLVEACGAHPDAVVVGHSCGGLVLPLVEAHHHVYLCAFIPLPGEPPAKVFGEAIHDDFGGTEHDELGRTYWPNVDLVASRFYRGHDRAWAEWAFPKLRPQGQTAASEPYPLPARPATPSTYVLAREDPAIRAEWARARAPDWLGVRPHELDGGHFPMLDRVSELADLLERVLVDAP